MLNENIKWIGLQIFADGAGDSSGSNGGAGSETTTVETSSDDGESRLRELGVPESVLTKRAKRSKAAASSLSAAKTQQNIAEAQQEDRQDAAAKKQAEEQQASDHTRMSWDEIMADPEYNKQMQSIIQARLKSAKGAEENMNKLAPAIELLARKYGLDGKNLDADALTKAISDDDSYYEDKALEMGVPVETAKKFDKLEREMERRESEEARTIEQQKIQSHIEKLQQQGEAMKAVFPKFDLATELRNPAFARMTSPNVGISVEDAYYACHRKEIQTAAMQATAQQTAQKMANAIRSGQSRPMENGTLMQAPSVTTFDYAHASREQREYLKKQIRDAAARGTKLYPGQGTR